MVLLLHSLIKAVQSLVMSNAVENKYSMEELSNHVGYCACVCMLHDNKERLPKDVIKSLALSIGAWCYDCDGVRDPGGSGICCQGRQMKEETGIQSILNGMTGLPVVQENLDATLEVAEELHKHWST